MQRMGAASHIYVDADACPVKDEVYRIAVRHQLHVLVVTNSYIRVPQDPLIERVAVPEGPDAADDWIAERVGSGDIVVTSDIPLARRCIEAGALVLTPAGRALTEASIGMALATRNLMDQLRATGEITGGPASFTRRNRSEFLQALDQAVRRARRRHGEL